MNRICFNITLVLLLILSSCANKHHHNFHKNHYLNLKKLNSTQLENECDEKILQTNVMTKFFEVIKDETVEGSALLIDSINMNQDDLDAHSKLKMEVCETESKFILFENEDSIVISDEAEIPQTTNKEKQDFNVLLMLLIMGGLLCSMALAASSPLMLFFCFIAGAATLIGAWIWSIILIKRLRKKAEEQKRKLIFAWSIFLVGTAFNLFLAIYGLLFTITF